MKGLLFAVVFMILLAQSALASPLQHYEVETEIMQDASTAHRINLVFVNMTSPSFTFFIQQPAYEIAATTQAGQISCTYTKKAIGTEVSCDLSKLTQERYSLIFTYKSFENVKKADGFFMFQESQKTPLDAQTMFFAVKLPEGSALVKSKNDTFPPLLPYTPSFGSVGTDGRRFIIAWQKQNLKAGDGLDISIAYETISADYSGLISIFAGSILGLIIIIILMAIGFWFVWKHFRTIRFVLPVLRGDEKIIMDVLLKYQKQGQKSVNQKVVVKESNYSKAKVSKVLKSLAERGLVKLERLGRTNKVYIAEKLEEKPSAKEEKSED